MFKFQFPKALPVELRTWECFKQIIGQYVEVTQLSGQVLHGTLITYRFESIFRAFVIEDEDKYYIVNWDSVMRITIIKQAQE